MMLRAYLWKEWREQRWTFAAIVASMALLSAAAWFLIPGWFGAANNCPTLALFVALLLGLVLVAGELMPGEMRRGQADFLRRLPGGSAMPIVAKLVTAAVTVVLCVVCALLSSWWLQGSENFVYSMAGSWPGLGECVVLAVAVGVWCVAVSSWLPRGTLSLPATILFWLGCGLPILYLVASSRGLAETLLHSTDRVVAQWLLLVAGLPVAVHAMGSALRFRRDPWGKTRSVALAAAVFVPLWGWVAVRMWQWHVADPGAPGFHIEHGHVGSGGRFAFLNTQATRLWRVDPIAANSFRWPHHALVVDLTTGEWRQLGGAGQRIQSANSIAGRGLDRNEPQDWLLAGSWDWSSRQELRVLDGATGLERGPLAAEDLPLEAQRNTTPFRLPDARRAWFEGDQLRVEGAAGGVDTLTWGRGDVPAKVAGFGIRFFRRSHGGYSDWYYDLSRQRAFRIPGKESLRNVAVRAGRWLVGRESPQHELSWFDPDNGITEPVAEELRGCQLLGIARDGRILLWSQRGGDPLVSLLDPESGVRTPVGFVDGPADLPSQVRLESQTPAGDPILACFRLNDWWLAVLRDGVLRSTAVLNGIRLLGVLDEDSVIVTARGRTIERLWWNSDRREVLWPRPVVTPPVASPPR